MKKFTSIFESSQTVFLEVLASSFKYWCGIGTAGNGFEKVQNCYFIGIF
jgi:hypothetical protein